MKKIIFLFIISISLFSACERDDICIDEITPHLIIRFYDKVETDDTKSVSKLLVSVTNSLNEVIETSAVKTTDSIVIPLNVDMEFTKIKLVKNADIAANAITDEFTINYTTEAVFVSRSCGYKTDYNDINLSDITTNWLQNIVINSAHINNEANAHLSIFH